jgi:isocitrate dehydrogenase (NAD+)
MRAACRVLDAATNGGINWIDVDAGMDCYKRTDTPLPDETVDTIRRVGLAFKSPLTTPSGGGFRSVNVRLREELELYAGVRRARTLPGIQTRFTKVNLITFRHNIGDLYGAVETVQGDRGERVVQLVTRFNEASFRKLCLRAFRWAKRNRKTRVTIAVKDNILKCSGGIYHEAFMAVAADFPGITADKVLIDAITMKLVQTPSNFQVLVAPNLFGDILTDLTAGLVGGLGVAPGGNIGDECAIFEAVHGTAPDIAGEGLANPMALILSGAEMLEHAGLVHEADNVSAAVVQALNAGHCTRDLGGTLNTTEFAEVVSNLLL